MSIGSLFDFPKSTFVEKMEASKSPPSGMVVASEGMEGFDFISHQMCLQVIKKMNVTSSLGC
jgi:hypothetical protein